MIPNLLILGGTAEAGMLAQAVANRGIRAVLSHAGRVTSPRPQPLPMRTGGFGGAEGLANHLREHAITHLIDATHPFASRIGRNAVEAAARTRVPLAALTRPPWRSVPGDSWQPVPDVKGAVAALAGPARRVMLALGRSPVAEFAAQPQHSYLLRMADPPETPPPLPDHEVVVARGPFDTKGDMELLHSRAIEIVVSRNSGGTGAQAKIHAARTLGLRVIMIDRPTVPLRRTEFTTVAEIFRWLDHTGADLGV